MSTQPGPGLARSLKGLTSTVLALVHTRLQLLTTEAAEEKQRLVGLIVAALAAVFLLVFGLLLLAVFITVLLWDSHRELALGISTALFLAAGLGAAFMTLRLARTKSTLFSGSLAELARDREALRDELQNRHEVQ